MMNLNRRHPGLTYKLGFLFAFIATFTFLLLRLPQNSQAASLDGFRPGNIISDYVMGNYTTMTAKQIDGFLHSHGSCNDKNTAKAAQYPSMHYHIENGHFVCLADEHFAKTGSNYGDLLETDEPTQTAAEIIYEVSQKYKINPQVLIVLLEKEQGLISDSWPNSIQFRSATGFGCPDTAPCDSEYYGLKNQLESAAWLFRTVLDGGWTNYPLGNNYILYNPNSACGGSVVNIENLATSSLYRYTPYQPNAAALAAGYGTATCGAYGNRNFYLFFMDWFGDPTQTKPEETTPLLGSAETEAEPEPETEIKIDQTDMLIPRYLQMNAKTEIVYFSEKQSGIKQTDTIKYFNKKTILSDNRQCLFASEQEEGNIWCAVFETLKEVKLGEEEMVFPRMMKAKKEASFINPFTKEETDKIAKGEAVNFTEKLVLSDGETYLISPDHEGCIAYSLLEETWTPMLYARNMVVEKGTYKINAFTGKDDKTIFMEKGMVRKYLTKTYRDGFWCLRTEYDHNLNTNNCVPDYMLNEAN